ncbi:MAG: IS200/IS605 family transposase [Dehalococcoidia bacterium]|nr:IS200/IS605 family transposase [Dehalococcoidia bacterium]
MATTSEHIHKRHNVSVIIYHYVCPAKYRRIVVSNEIDTTIKETCIEIEKRYDIRFLEIGMERDHIHFLIQTMPNNSPSQIIQIIKSITAKEVFRKHQEVRRQLWGGEFWADGYYVATVGRSNNEAAVARYVREQGKEAEYKKLHSQQLGLFE